MRDRFKSTYFKAGLTIFLAGCALILFYFTAQTVGDLTKYVVITTKVLTPFIIGFVLAYLMCPVYNACVRRLRFFMNGRISSTKAVNRISKIVSLITSIAVLLVVVAGLLYLVIPQLADSIASLVVALPDYFDRLITWIQSKGQNYPEIAAPLEKMIENSNEKIMEWMTNKVLPASMDIVDSISAGVMGILSTIMNIIIGIVAMVYMLASKDVFTAQSRKFSYAVMKPDNAEQFLKGARHVNDTFSKFISGNLLDSVIVGILCFACMTIFHWPYAMLISVVVGVTNFIPFFGPFIGGIPSAILLCTDNLWTGLYFGIFIIVLQQLDGNVIKPKVLGDSIGLPSFWVMFSIIVGGGLFGFVGMIMAVPVFALIYSYVGYRIRIKLVKKGRATDLNEYIDTSIYEMRDSKFSISRLFRKAKNKADDEKDNSEA